MTGIIDVHHHMIPDQLRSALNDHGVTTVGGEAVPPWSPEASEAIMERFGIERAVLSVPVPLHFLDPAPAAALARRINEFGHCCASRPSGRFGYFATLPLPDIEASIAIAEEALDQGQATGIGMLTNHAGLYQGDPRLDPLYEVLDQRAAVLFIHPTVFTGTAFPVRAFDGSPLPGVQASQLEFGFDTTRAVANILFHSIPDRFPRLRFVFTHSAACVPSTITKLIDRRPLVRAYQRHLQEHGIPPEVDLLLDQLRGAEARAREQVAGLYFDTALSTSPASLRSLRDIVPSTQILLGTDYPFGQEIGLRYTLTGLAESEQFDAAELDAIRRGNAAPLGLAPLPDPMR